MDSNHPNRQHQVLLSTTGKKYALTPSSTQTLLSRNELRSIERFVNLNAPSTVTRSNTRAADQIPTLPFQRVKQNVDDVLQLRAQPIRSQESALDVPLRYASPEEFHLPPFEDPPSHIPLARRIAALIKGTESVPMTWDKPSCAKPLNDMTVAQVTALKDGEARAQAAMRSGNHQVAARLYCCQGALQYSYGNMEKAIKAFEKGLQLFETLQDAKGTAYCLNVIGVCYFRIGEHKMALVFHKKQEALGSYLAQCVAQLNMGVSYAALGELEFAEQALQDALTNAREASEPMLETIALGNLGLVSLRTGNMSAAQTNLEGCLEHCSVAGDKSGAAICLLLLGEIYARIFDYTHALFYFEHAYRVGGEANMADVVAMARASIGIARGDAALRDAVLLQAAAMGDIKDVPTIVGSLPP